MKLQTITTLELSSKCSLNCKYCIQSQLRVTQERKPGIMTDEVFEHSLELLKILVKRGTQKEINLNGNGESTLDPQLPERIKAVKEVMGNRTVMLCTNGVGVDKQMIMTMREAGIDRIDLSPHSAYDVRRIVEIFRELEWNAGIVNMGSIVDSHNWAGQLPDCYALNKIRINIPCHPLMEGRGYIQSEGNITPCCYDFKNLGVFGHVFNLDVLSKEIEPFNLCETCHQVIPEGLFTDTEVEGVAA